MVIVGVLIKNGIRAKERVKYFFVVIIIAQGWNRVEGRLEGKPGIRRVV